MPTLLYNNENCTMKKVGKLRNAEAEMKFLRKTAKHTIFDQKINQNICKKLLKKQQFLVEVRGVT
jgi:hypothetical protein